ncbi:MAG: DNA-3-methyladenine glycosylase I [Planctomycetaceae bacterium]|nr:DNA-3-methyladenine glycosylase I [Planctomycetaceae bacterium]
MKRCAWADSHPLHVEYHDVEWGVPSRDDGHLFEMLTLEGAQAGLSWTTILKKREGYRHAFAQFDPHKVARFSAAKCEKLLQNPDIVRNRLKVESTVDNAKAFLRVQQECGSFADYIWGFVDGHPIQNHWTSIRDVPAETPVSRAMSKDLKKRGFRFVGSTICYAFMQAVGMVNDHEVGCFRHGQVAVTPRATSAVRSDRLRRPS